MRIAILGGAGAMGGIFGAWLSRAGHEVSLVDVFRPAIEAINASGLVVEERDGTAPLFRLAATDDPATVGTVDLIVTFVKCYHTAAAVTSALPMLGRDTAILSLQNGWGNVDRIAAVAGRERVLVGLTYHSGTLIGPGRVKHPGHGMTHLGELSGEMTPRLARVDAALRLAGFETTQSPRILDEVWKKLALNCCTLPTSALLRFFAHELVAHPAATQQMAMILDEVVAVARAKGIALDYGERWAAITGLLEKAVGGKASMLQDVEAGRQTEIEVINGAIAAAGRETGVATPVNDTMVAMVTALQSKYLAAGSA
jgi:2-dehydropantoate 2-reductase